ncbi:MAG: ABC transporter permease, partial [Saprospiraceae bacterium]
SIAMYADRQKELGVRKVLGAQSYDISFQLLAEAIILALLCFPFCVLLLWSTLPYFYELMDLSWSRSILFRGSTLLTLLSLLLLSGFLSGTYPAVAYGRKSMLHLFKQKMNRILGNRYFNFRNSLITFQFVMMVGLLSITFFIYQQMQYISNTDLGYNEEGIIFFGVDGVEKYKTLKKDLLNLPEVEAIGGNGLPGSEMYNQGTYKMKGTDVTLSDGTTEYFDLGTIEALNLKCDACELLEKGKDRIFVINRTAAKKLAKIKGIEPDQLVGETLISEPEWENEQYGFGVPRVIDGIVDDFKFFSLKYPDQSLLLSIRPEPVYTYNMMVRANTKNWKATIQKIESAYSNIETVRPFNFTFLEDRINQLYADERKSGILMGGLSLIAIILALTGLMGIVSYIIFSRQKEISVRKILGASVGNILFIFNKEFIVLMGIATIVATPITIILANKWLEEFAFKITPQIWVVGLAGLGAVFLVGILVSIQSMRVATQNPQTVLRSER